MEGKVKEKVKVLCEDNVTLRLQFVKLATVLLIISANRVKHVLLNIS